MKLWQCKCWCLKMDGLTGAEKPSDDCDQPSTRNGPGSNRNQSGPAGLIWPGSVGGVIVTILPQQPNGQLPRPDQSHWLQSHHLFQLEIRVLIHLQQSWETIIVPPKGKMKICGYLTTMWNPYTIFGNTRHSRKCFPIHVNLTFNTKNLVLLMSKTTRQITYQSRKRSLKLFSWIKQGKGSPNINSNISIMLCNCTCRLQIRFLPNKHYRLSRHILIMSC